MNWWVMLSRGNQWGGMAKRFSAKVLLEEAVLKLDFGLNLSHLKESRYVTT
jgi:hypothetical protein